MAFVVVSAIGGGLGIGVLMSSYGIGTALACAIPGGSLCAAVAAFIIMARRGEDWSGDDRDDDGSVDQTDQMVEALREIARRGSTAPLKPIGKQSNAA